MNDTEGSLKIKIDELNVADNIRMQLTGCGLKTSKNPLLKRFEQALSLV